MKKHSNVFQPPEHLIYRPGKVQVIRNTSDSRLDYWLPLKRAKELYEQGKFHFDITNEAYSTSRSGKTIESQTGDLYV